MSFNDMGRQSVTFVTLTPADDVGELGVPLLVESTVTIGGCLHNPMRPRAGAGAGPARAEEAPEIGVAVATDWWQTWTPAVPPAMNAKAADVIRVDGVTFRMIGDPKVYTDFSGQPHHVVIVSERQTIG